MSYQETIRQADVEGGRVQGIPAGNPVYTVFKGIPYAAPPVGQLRWKAPQPVIPWEGTRLCCQHGNIAQQTIRYGEPLYGREFFENIDPRGEDCLYLNIWTPAKTTEDKLPVLFWIHGGGFFGGAGTEPEFDGEGFSRRGVILVTINYRLGAIGFLAHPELSAENDRGVSGNYGLLDQIAAFHWVRRNIAAFGGDPDRITIAGQSAGARSVLCLITSGLCREELAGAILQSNADAGPRNPGATPSLIDAEQQGVAFMKAFGCDNIQQLRQVSAEQLMASQTIAFSGFRFGPIVDGYVLEDEPGMAILKGVHPDIPYLCGNTGDEGGMEKMDLFARIPQVLSSGNMAFCANQDRLGRKPVYAYNFNRPLPGDEMGAFHACELWYEFETLNRCWRPFTGVDYDISLAMATYFASFVKQGDPNTDGLPRWEAYTREKPQCMELGAELKLTPVPETEYYRNKMAAIRQVLEG